MATPQHYTITTWLDDADMRAATAVRGTRNGAVQHARAQAHAILSAHGKLDTNAARRIMAALDRWNDLLPIGEQRSCTISDTGRTIIMTREA